MKTHNMFELSKEQINRYKIMSFDQCANYCDKSHSRSSINISIVTYEGDLKDRIRVTENNNVKDILYLKFGDLDISDNPSLCMQESDARQIVNFVNKWYEKIETIIVHCEGGKSRSAGVCAAIMRVKEGSDYPIFRSKNKYPNMTCYLRTLKAFGYIQSIV